MRSFKKKIHGSRTTNIYNMNQRNAKDIMKIVKSYEDYGLSIKCVIKTIKIETKEQIGRFLNTPGQRILIVDYGTQQDI